MRGQPLPQARHRGLLDAELAPLHQITGDGFVGLAVLIGIGHADNLTVRQLHAARALHLQQKGVECIIDPHQLFTAQRRVAVDDRALGVRHNFAALHATAHALALELRIQVGQLDAQQVIGHAIKRRVVAAAGLARAAQHRFVIAGDQPGLAAAAGFIVIGHTPRLKLRFKELPCGARLAQWRGQRPLAHRLPVRLVLKGDAATQKGLQRRCRIVVTPTGQTVEGHAFIVQGQRDGGH